jgi:hypothetical protein
MVRSWRVAGTLADAPPQIETLHRVLALRRGQLAAAWRNRRSGEVRILLGHANVPIANSNRVQGQLVDASIQESCWDLHCMFQTIGVKCLSHERGFVWNQTDVAAPLLCKQWHLIAVVVNLYSLVKVLSSDLLHVIADVLQRRREC